MNRYSRAFCNYFPLRRIIKGLNWLWKVFSGVLQKSQNQVFSPRKSLRLRSWSLRSRSISRVILRSLFSDSLVIRAKLSSARHWSMYWTCWNWSQLVFDFASFSLSLSLSWPSWALYSTLSIPFVISYRSTSKHVMTSANMPLTSLAQPNTEVRPRDDDINWVCCLVLDDYLPLSVSIEIISLTNVQNVSTTIHSDTSLDGEAEIVYLIFSCFGLEVKSVAERFSPG